MGFGCKRGLNCSCLQRVLGAGVNFDNANNNNGGDKNNNNTCRQSKIGGGQLLFLVVGCIT